MSDVSHVDGWEFRNPDLIRKDWSLTDSGLIPRALPRTLPPTTPAALAKVCELEKRVLEVPQTEIKTHHVIHGGVYYRTICIPARNVLTGASIKIPTTLVVCGCASVLIGDGEEYLVEGYRVFAASAGRKQAFITHEDTWITMSFKTNAKTVEEAEAEFTDDHERLMSRNGVNEIVITGE